MATLEAVQAVAPSAGRLPDPQLVAAVDNLPINTDERFSFTQDFMTMRRIGLMQSFPSQAKRRLQSAARGGGDHGCRGAAAQDTFRDRAGSVRRVDRRRGGRRIKRATARSEAGNGIAGERPLAPRLQAVESSAAEALAAQSSVARLDERIAAFDQIVEARKAELARWVGDAADRPLAPIPTDRELGHSPESLLAAVPEHAPLAPMIAQLDAAKTDVELARAEKRPDWSAELSYQARGSDFSDMVSLEFRVGLPLFATHRQNPVIAEKLAAVRAQEAERDAEIRMHTAEVRAVLAEWRVSRERLKRYDVRAPPTGERPGARSRGLVWNRTR